MRYILSLKMNHWKEIIEIYYYWSEAQSRIKQVHLIKNQLQNISKTRENQKTMHTNTHAHRGYNKWLVKQTEACRRQSTQGSSKNQ